MKLIKLGRDESNDFVVDHPAVSGYHADIYVFDNGSMQYMDHSTNGTMIGGCYVHGTSYYLTGNETIVLPGGIEVPVAAILASDVKRDTSKPVDESNFQSYSIERVETDETCTSAQTSVVENEGMGFGETLGYFFNHYADFSGRARRREYWFMYLWGLIFGIIPYVNIIMALVLFIPYLALSVRRMHDVGRSGFVLFLSLIPIVGGIILFVWTVTDSDKGDNEYGPSPKYSVRP